MPQKTTPEGSIMATRVRWLRHAALHVESGGRHILIDPFLTGNPAAAATPGAGRVSRPRRKQPGPRLTYSTDSGGHRHQP
jgi:L-ascorbate metabolism protein UlaG (beta-lactamase superfamily)